MTRKNDDQQYDEEFLQLEEVEETGEESEDSEQYLVRMSLALREPPLLLRGLG